MDTMEEDISSEGQGSTAAASVSTEPPRTRLPSPPFFGPRDSTSQALSNAAKRRRGLGIVTPHACTECRKKRAKCDGMRPCGRCRTQKDVECVYEIPVRQSKENLRSEIEQLRRQQRSSDSVFAALSRPDVWQEVLERLRAGHTVESISEWLAGAPPAGGGPMPSFPRQSLPGTNYEALGDFSGASASSYTPTRLSMGSFSPLAAVNPQGPTQGLDQPGSWAGPLSQGHLGLATSNPQLDALNWRSDASLPPQSRIGSWVQHMTDGKDPPESNKYRGVDEVLSAPQLPNMKPVTTWTNVTADTTFVQHLLALYFCWEYPTFASLSKEHFLTDFKEGRSRYCSSILINALLALGCRFSNQPESRAEPDNPYTSGDHFFKECQRLFYLEEDHHSLTTIQALGIMSIREASCGRDSESWYYAGQSIRLAIEMGLHQVAHEVDDPDESAVQAATFWGAFALDHAWSLATGSLPQCSRFPRLPPKPSIIDDIEASLWVPYTDNGAPLQRSCEQPSNVRSVYKCFCELSELVHKSLYTLHSPGKPLSSRDLLNLYTQYLNWYDKIPEVLRLGHNFTPAVLFAHMYYHFAILLLFRPLIKLRVVGSSILPRDVCSQAADAIQGLLRSYSRLYTLRRTPSFVPYFVLTSSIMHLAIGATALAPGQDTGNKDVGTQFAEGIAQSEHGTEAQQQEARRMKERVSQSISQGIADLTEMAPCHHFAEQALNILRYLAKKWNIEVKIPSEPRGTEGEMHEIEQRVRPMTTSLNFFAPNMTEQDMSCTLGPAHEREPGHEKEPVSRKKNSTDNPLFWPFPMQGRPLLPSGLDLREAGFEMV